MVEPVQAFDFPPGLTWIQTSQPLSLRRELAGHVVLLHFWTSGCVPCHQVLADLAMLELRHADAPFAVIGVHTGKFQRDRDPEHVRMAVAQLAIRHPVVVDEGMRIWRRYACRAWPTLVLIDGRGCVRFAGAGLPNRERLAAAVQALLHELGPSRPYEFAAPEAIPLLRRDGLAFPGKVAVDPARDWLWISDTGHHRVVAVAMATGATMLVAGDGLAGAGDGALATASFCSPQGLAVVGSKVFVADTGNHLLREIDPELGRVTTVLGTGAAGADFAGGGFGTEQALCSPWDLVAHGEDLFVAMAGTHQIWRYSPATGSASVFAGAGGGSLADGAVQLALLAQPSGLAIRGDVLAFADSETSAIRWIDLAEGLVHTWVGEGLFGYGDIDGPFATSRFQHPRGVAFAGEDVLVADTFNHKVRRLSPSRRSVETLLGPEDGVRLPGGLAVHGTRLFVADTGAHRILRADLESGQCEEFPVRGLPAAATGHQSEYASAPALVLGARAAVRLRITLPLPQGARLHPDLPVRVTCRNESGTALALEVATLADVDGSTAVVHGVATGEPGEGMVRLSVRYQTCREPDAVAHTQELRRLVPVRLVEAGPDAAGIE